MDQHWVSFKVCTEYFKVLLCRVETGLIPFQVSRWLPCCMSPNQPTTRMSLVWGGEGPLPPQFCRGISGSPGRCPQWLLRVSRCKGANTQSSPSTNAPRKVNRKLSAPGLKPLMSQSICGPFTPDFSWGPLRRERGRETAVNIRHSLYSGGNRGAEAA